MDVGAWLRGLGLEEHAEAFAENGVDAALLPELTNEDLKDLGVARLADRKRLLKAIVALSEREEEKGSHASLLVPSQGERRQVTVLFADMSGFTQLSNELGAEQAHALLNRYFETVDGIVAGYGGHVDKHIGDNVMAVFGAPIAHSNDPERAVRAALDIHRAMLRLIETSDHDLTAHVGVASGQVVASGTGSKTYREYTVTGESVNLAARLQEKAEPGETLISNNVYGAVSSVADCTAMGEIDVKGFAAPVKAWRLAGLRDDFSIARDSPFIGRRSERRQFEGIVETCLETGAGQALFIRGEAGIGKTRLVEEFAAIAESKNLAIHKALVLDFGVGKGQDAVRSLVRSFLDLAPEESKARRRDAVDKAIESRWLVPDDQVFANDLLDLPQSIDLRSLYDAMDNSARIAGKQAVVAKLMRSWSEQQPMLIMVEDIHWADPLTLGHLARMASAVAACPAILVMTSRLDGDPLGQTWRVSLQGSPLTTIDLQPLVATEAEELARSFTKSTDQFLEACIARAEGNPLFLEQLLRNAEDGTLSDMPGSIHSLVLARMDRLAPIDKRALQTAAVVGQRFAPDLLQHLVEDPDYACDKLIENRLVRPEGGGYLFAHALIREGVYSSLLQAQKCNLHRRAADWFAERDLGLWAEHLDRAEDPEAPQAYLKAAEAETRVYHFERARDLAELGVGIARAATDKFALTCLRGQILHDLGSIPEGIETYRTALDLAADGGERAKAWYGLAAGMRLIDDFDQALEAIDRAETGAFKHGLTLALAQIHHLRGNLHFSMGNLEHCREQHHLALKYARQAQSPEHEARALGGLGDAAYAQGRMRTAYGHFQDCIVLCREHGFGRIEVSYLSMRGVTRHYLGDLEGALEDFVVARETAVQVGHQRAEMIACLSARYTAKDTANSPFVEATNQRALKLSKRLGAKRFEAGCLDLLASRETTEGRRADAAKLLRKALKISQETAIDFYGPIILGHLALATDDAKERELAIRDGLAILESGAVAHSHFWFYRYVMEVALNLGHWDDANTYALALEDFTRPEPLPWTNFFIARARALATYGRGKRDKATLDELRCVRDEGERMGLKTSLPALEEALREK